MHHYKEQNKLGHNFLQSYKSRENLNSQAHLHILLFYKPHVTYYSLFKSKGKYIFFSNLLSTRDNDY